MANQKRKPTNQEWARAIARAWVDDTFRELLESQPIAAFMKMGVEVDTVINIPDRPEGMSDEQLTSYGSAEGSAPLTSSADMESGGASAFTTLGDPPFTTFFNDESDSKE